MKPQGHGPHGYGAGQPIDAAARPAKKACEFEKNREGAASIDIRRCLHTRHKNLPDRKVQSGKDRKIDAEMRQKKSRPLAPARRPIPE